MPYVIHVQERLPTVIRLRGYGAINRLLLQVRALLDPEDRSMANTAILRPNRHRRLAQQGGYRAGINAWCCCHAIRDSRIATTSANKFVWVRQARMAFSIAIRAKPRGADRPCSHYCSVRFEICNFNAASLCEKSFRSRHARNLRGNAPAANLWLRT